MCFEGSGNGRAGVGGAYRAVEGGKGGGQVHLHVQVRCQVLQPVMTHTPQLQLQPGASSHTERGGCKGTSASPCREKPCSRMPTYLVREEMWTEGEEA